MSSYVGIRYMTKMCYVSLGLVFSQIQGYGKLSNVRFQVKSHVKACTNKCPRTFKCVPKNFQVGLSAIHLEIQTSTTMGFYISY